MQLSTENIISLYAPLGGVVILAFWSGVLTQRVSDLVRRVLHLEKQGETDTGVAVQIGVLQSELSHVKTSQESQTRSMNEIQRTLANIASGRTHITRFDQESDR